MSLLYRLYTLEMLIGNLLAMHLLATYDPEDGQDETVLHRSLSRTLTVSSLPYAGMVHLSFGML